MPESVVLSDSNFLSTLCNTPRCGVRWESGNLPSYSTPEAEFGGRAVTYNFSTSLKKCYLAGVKLWRKWECPQAGSRCCPALPCSAGACRMVSSSASTFSWALTYMSHDHARGIFPLGIRGYLVFCFSVSVIKQENGLGSIHMVRFCSSWTGCALTNGFLIIFCDSYKCQVDDSFSQQSRMNLGTLLRCTPTLLAYIIF